MATDVDRLALAREHAEAKEYDKAWRIVTDLLYEEPNDPKVLIVACSMLDLQGNVPLAYQMAKRLTDMVPKSPTVWVNLGKTADALWRYQESENAYNRALTLVMPNDDHTKASIFNNLSALQVQHGMFEKAKLNAERALKLEPDFRKAKHNLGISQLALKDWSRGWANYEHSLGSDSRTMFKYADEPQWRGEPGKTVVIFGEQGIGDEICAASMIPDAIAVAEKVVIDCDERLAGLFRRSFPKAKVYGTRTKKVLNWDEEDHQVDYSIAATQLGGIFRLAQESFPIRPYLRADPDRVFMWRELWKTKGKPVVGLAWSGGIQITGQHFRKMSVEELAPILGMDCHFVSLQYKDEEIKGVEQYAHATLVKDYDATAALVASLDAVVSVPTSVAHLSGALGVPTIAMKAPISCWKYNAGLPFHPCHLIEHHGWKETAQDAALKLRGIINA